MNKKARRAAVAGTGVVALIMGCAFTQADSMTHSNVQGISTSIEEAAAAALTSVSGTIIEAELELDDNRAVWEIEIVSDANQVVSVEVDGFTGQVLSTEPSDDIAPKLSNVVSLQQAIDTIREVENGVFIEMELEDDDDEFVWEIETIGDDNEQSEYRVDGITGKIL